MGWMPASRTWRWRVGAMVSMGVAASALVASRAPAAQSVTPNNSPTVTNGPADGSVTTSTTATFAFTYPAANVTFRCALDGDEYRTCTSPKAYTGLGSSRHTFVVAAVLTGGNTRGPSVRRTWTIDRNPPTVTTTFPANNSRYNAAHWAAGCAPVGICGTAIDATSVASVSVSVQSLGTFKYWNGSAFASNPAVLLPAAGTTTWKFAFARPADGTYNAKAVATDGLGNASSGGSRTFMIDSTPPPAPIITIKPDDTINATTASFSFTKPIDPKAPGDNNTDHTGVRMQCALDAATPSECEESTRYNNLSLGQHCFNVYAIDRVGNRSTPRTYCWFVVTNTGFTISGDAASGVAPGSPGPVDVRFTNPFSFALKIVTLNATVSSTKPGCANSNFRVVTVPAAVLNGMSLAPPGSSSLSTLGIADPTKWLQVVMDETNRNQTVCLGATLKLTFTGTATKP